LLPQHRTSSSASPVPRLQLQQQQRAPWRLSCKWMCANAASACSPCITAHPAGPLEAVVLAGTFQRPWSSYNSAVKLYQPQHACRTHLTLEGR
jgi:hypothetical protein